MSTTTPTVPFTDRTSLSLTLGERNLGDVIRPAAVLPIQNEEVAIARSLDASLDARPLSQRVQSRDRVLILSDDSTRPTPVAQVLPLILKSLYRAGVHRQAIEILIAVGTHRTGFGHDSLRYRGPSLAQLPGNGRHQPRTHARRQRRQSRNTHGSGRSGRDLHTHLAWPCPATVNTSRLLSLSRPLRYTRRLPCSPRTHCRREAI